MPARIVLTDTAEDAAGRAADALAAALSAGLRARGEALLALSGGRTPVPVLQALSRRDLDWSNVTIALVDERWVDPASSDSNQRLVEAHLLQHRAAASRFIPMKSAGAAPQDGVAPLEAALGLAPVFDAVLLGMGEDGHFASLFPGSPALAAGLDPASLALAIAVPAGAGGLAPPQPRLSLTLAAIARARSIVLLTGGDAKLAVLQAALSKEGESRLRPIAALLAARPDTLILHGPQ